MSTHKYAVGDRVKLLPNTANTTLREGVYTIVRVLPFGSRGAQYRAKSAHEPFECVLDEAELHRM